MGSEEQESLKRMAREPDDVDAGTIEIGHNDRFEVVINLDRDRNGIGHIVFSPRQARHLANTLLKHATEALQEWREAQKQPRELKG
jgi:hypothetical protein